MIELTRRTGVSPRASGRLAADRDRPTTQKAYVLLHKDEYERLTKEDYDDSPWTDEERNLLAAEVDAMLEDDMAIEDAP